MKPFILFLRIAMVCVLVFFVFSAIKKMLRTPPPIVTAPQVQPNRASAEPPRPIRTPEVRPTPEIQKPSPQTQNSPTDPAPVDADPKPTFKLTPTGPSSGAPDTISFIVQQCRHAGENIFCYGMAKNTAEIAQSVQLEDSKAVDDQGRSFTVYLFGGGFSFDTGSREKLTPGIPVRFFVKVADPYPRVQAVTLNLTASIGRNYYPMVFKNIPVQ